MQEANKDTMGMRFRIYWIFILNVLDWSGLDHNVYNEMPTFSFYERRQYYRSISENCYETKIFNNKDSVPSFISDHQYPRQTDMWEALSMLDGSGQITYATNFSSPNPVRK